MTEAGAAAVLLSPELRARIGWLPTCTRPPDAAWEAAEGRAGLSTGERAMVAIGLGLWNGTRSGVDVAALATLDGGNLRRLSAALAALADGGIDGLTRWASRQLAAEVHTPS